MNIIPVECPRCHSSNLYRFGKDKDGLQKYQCKDCKRQFAPESDATPKQKRNYPPCPICGKASFLHHDYKYYSNFRCSDKSCYHSFFVAKTFNLENVDPPSSTNIIGKFDFKRMRHPMHIVLMALNLFYMANASTRKISFFLLQQHDVKVSHVTISKWVTKFAPIFKAISDDLKSTFDISASDEWHLDETVVKISGEKYYLWLAIDSETRLIIDFHLNHLRNSDQAFSLLSNIKNTYGSPKSLVSDRLWSYELPIKVFFPNAKHIQVQSFKDDISNNVIEAFNGQFKAWYKSKRAFSSFDTANAMISTYIFAYNFLRPHYSLSGLSPAEVFSGPLPAKRKKFWLLAS